MKRMMMIGLLLLWAASAALAQLSWQGGSNPEQDQAATLLFDATGTPLAGNPGTLYLHTGVTLNGTIWQNVIGNWGNNTTQPSFTALGSNLYKLDIAPSIMAFYGVATGSITQVSVVVRNAAGNAQTADLFINVGSFDMTLLTPEANSTSIWAGGPLSVTAKNVGGPADYALLDPDGALLHSVSADTSFAHDIAAPVNGTYSLTATRNGISIVRSFSVVIGQNPASEAMPAGLEDGVNYFENDASKVALVLNAPGKDFAYVAGNFNNWAPTAADVMKKDPASGKFWIEIGGLTPGEWYAFQYWVCDATPHPGSPTVVKTADPFSTLVLSSFDDPEIIELGVYPGLPAFSSIAPGQTREVTAVQTGPNAFWQYEWTSTAKPNASIDRKDLIIYEVLIRDFDATRTYQDLIDRIDYFKNLHINAIQLMPVMEFEGNMSWGYNPVYHLAPDKRYGSPAKLKEFIDLCHQNDIAVILDIALNHVFGRSPLERMWMLDSDGDGWSDGISPDNPYCNVMPMHTANVGADLNHFREPENLTNTYVLRTLREWIEEYRIDGFRWDLTQGFTNSCSANDGGCTGSNLPDRITKLKWYADMQWEMDPYFYVIFEHWAFGEIPEYTNYRLNESPSKGVMCWRRGDNEYANILKGNFANVGFISDASTYRIQGNMESHDEERLTYKALTEAGQTNGNLAKVHARVPALGAIFFLVPGPKMIWHFAPLGWELSIFTCSNGTVNGNCRLDTKPQPQWQNNWLENPARRKIYDEWGTMIELRTKADVFEEGQWAFNFGLGTGRPRLDVWTSTAPSAELSYIMVHTNFTNSPATFPAYFPYTGTWYNMLNNQPLEVSSTTQNLTLPADGGYVIYGNQPNPYTTTSSTGPSPLGAGLAPVLALPNPASAGQAIELRYEQAGQDATLLVYALDGRLIQQQALLGSSGTATLDAPLAAGLYLVELRGSQGRALQKLLVH